MCLLQKLVNFNFLNATRYLPSELYCRSRAAMLRDRLDGTVNLLASIFPLKNENFAIDYSMA